MPLINRSLKSFWDDLFEIDAESAWPTPPGRSQVDLNYHKFVIFPRDRTIGTNIKQALDWDNTTRTYVVGCGFGWVIEVLEDELGLSSVVGNETSTYIQTNKSINEDTDIQAAIEGVGLATNVGDGLTLFNTFRNGGNPRSARAADISDSDLVTGIAQRAERDRIGGPGFELLTYDGFLNTLNDAEAIDYSTRLNGMNAARVSHHVFPGFLNGHTLEEWKLLIPSDTFVEANTYRVL